MNAHNVFGLEQWALCLDQSCQEMPTVGAIPGSVFAPNALEAEQVTVGDLSICSACDNTGWVSSAPDDCPEWERDAYQDQLCDCDIGILREFTEEPDGSARGAI